MGYVLTRRAKDVITSEQRLCYVLGYLAKPGRIKYIEAQVPYGKEQEFMDDVTENNYSEEIHYELTEINEKEDDVHRYILKLVIDEKYLENATYPVAIDPTVTWNGTTDLPETYVLNSAKGTNYFSSGVKTFSVGKGSQGVFRTYFRAKSLAKTPHL